MNPLDIALNSQSLCEEAPWLPCRSCSPADYHAATIYGMDQRRKSHGWFSHDLGVRGMTISVQGYPYKMVASAGMSQ